METQTTQPTRDYIVIASDVDIDEAAALAAGGSPREPGSYTVLPLHEAALHLSLAEPVIEDHFSDVSVATRNAIHPSSYAVDPDDALHEVSEAMKEIGRPAPRHAAGAHSVTNEPMDEYDIPLSTSNSQEQRPQTLFSRLVRPGGRVNRRFVAVVAGFACLALVILFTGTRHSTSGAGTAAASNTADGQPMQPDQIRVTNPDSTLHSPNQYPGPAAGGAPTTATDNRSNDEIAKALGMAPAVPTASPSSEPTQTAPRTTLASNRPAAPAVDQESSLNSSAAYASQKTFNMPLRAGTKNSQSTQFLQTAQSSPSDATPATNSKTQNEGETVADPAKVVRLAAGTRLPMTLLDPLQSGIATTADATLDADIRGKSGELIIPAGTTVSIPFLALHTNGRLMNAPQSIQVALPNGRTLILKGSIKGQDGLAGLTGKMTKTGSGKTLGRVARGIGRAGAQAGQQVLGRATGGVGINTNDISLDDAVSDRYGAYDPYARAPREVVTVPAGVHFQFIVGQ